MISRVCYSVVSVLVLLSDELVLGEEICTSLHSVYRTTCNSGYECCDNNTRCCAKGLSLGAIIGIVFGVLFVLTICLVCALIVSKKQKKNNVIRTSFSNQPHSQAVTIANISNSVNGYGASHGQPMNGHYGYGFGHPPPIPGMMHVAPPPYSQCVGPPYNPAVQPLVVASQPGMPFSSSGPHTGPMCGPLAPAYITPARTMFKSNPHNATHQ